MSPSALLARRERALVVALALCLAPSLAAAGPTHRPTAASASVPVTLADADGGLYLVQFAPPPVAQATLPMRMASDGSSRPDLASERARSLADELAATQSRVLAEALGPLGREAKPILSYRYAYDGVLVALDRDSRVALAAHSQVRSVEAVRALPVSTDVGPRFIGASDLWTGTATDGLPGTRGEGRVVGIIDTGINWDSPSFADVGGDGYDHANPFGRYLGLCGSRAVAHGKGAGPACNDKLIGAYAMSYRIVEQINRECELPDPRDGELGLTREVCEQLGVPLTDSPTASDDDGHGSHTAATAVGNVTRVRYQGREMDISGVAPHANLIVYDACHTNVYGEGTCLDFATLAAIEQAIQDGVDAINYSISGGEEPWSEANSLAFLSAADAGIFVAAAAGNDGPVPGQVSHREPWTTTVAASTHGRDFGYRYTVDGPTPVPPDLVGQAALLGSAGGPFTQAIPPQTALVTSPGFDGTEDGCDAFPPDLFRGAVALIRRGTCEFVLKVWNAEQAGAVAVMVANDGDGLLRMGGDGFASIPAFGVTRQQGDDLRDFRAAHANATLGVPNDLELIAVPSDVVANFSSRGPNGAPLVKPDVSAPGVDILSALAGDGTSYGLLSGTSMATPHVAGASLLLRDLHPEWSVPELKSALMMSARRTGVTLESGGPASSLERGAGRIDLTAAARTGLVMNETPLRMLRADPDQGGDPASLNLPSLQSNGCAESCSWTRRFRNTTSAELSYQATFDTTSAMVVEMIPGTLVVPPGGTATATFRADTTGVPSGNWSTGDVRLLPSDASRPTLTLPVAVRSIEAVPQVVLSPSPLVVDIRAGSAPLAFPVEVRNEGVRDLEWQHDLAGAAHGSAIYSHLRKPGFGFGAPSGRWQALDGRGAWLADAFELEDATTIGGLFADGFISQTSVADAYDAVSFYVFPDAGGVPAGNPDAADDAAWSYTAALGSPGLDVTAGEFDASIQLDLPIAGQRLTLPAGKYWLVVSTHNIGVFADSREWYWFGTDRSANRGEGALLFDADNLYGAGGPWQPLEPLLGTQFAGLSFEVQRSVGCDVPWVRPEADRGVVVAGAEQGLQLRIDPEGLAIGRHEANFCVTTNDPHAPFAAMPVVLNVTGAPTAPTGTVAATPSRARAGEVVSLRVTVTPGTWPESTRLSVDMDLTPIGGSASQRLYDDGSNGDAVANDRIHSANVVVAATSATGSHVLRATIRDAQGRSRPASTTFTVVGAAGEAVFADSFE